MKITDGASAPSNASGGGVEPDVQAALLVAFERHRTAASPAHTPLDTDAA
jgi:hypothetical protein